MAVLVPEFISVLRDIRDIKYPDIVTKHGVVVAKEALISPHYTNIDLVGGSITSVNTNASYISNINLNATNIVAIQGASANAVSALASKNSCDASVVTTNANVVTTNANVVTCTAKASIASQVLAMTTSTATLVSGSNATANWNATTGVMAFGIPTGPVGPKGDSFTVNAVGLAVDRSIYDAQVKGFSFLAIDTALIYFKLSATSGDWSIGAPFGKGDKGDIGVGISTVILTSTVGLVDTYTITYTDATTSTFDVTNGQDAIVVDNLTSTSTTEALSANMGKTLEDTKATKANPIFTGLITEQVSVSTLTLGATSSVQTYTATANYTIVDDLADGESVTFIITNAGWTPTYPTITWWETTEPTLGTTDKLFFEKIGATLWGSQVASYA